MESNHADEAFLVILLEYYSLFQFNFPIRFSLYAFWNFHLLEFLFFFSLILFNKVGIYWNLFAALELKSFSMLNKRIEWWWKLSVNVAVS